MCHNGLTGRWQQIILFPSLAKQSHVQPNSATDYLNVLTVTDYHSSLKVMHSKQQRQENAAYDYQHIGVDVEAVISWYTPYTEPAYTLH